MSFRTFFNDENKSSSSGSASVSAAATVTNELASNLIIGFGPGGIAAALVACMKDTMKRKVIVLTDRASFTRTPIFRLDVDILPFLEELVGAATIQEYFQKNLIGPKQKMGDWEFHVIQIKTLEKMLFDSLRQQDRFEIIIVPKSTTYNIDSKNHLFEFSMDVNSVTQKRSIPFKYLIAADGCTHPTANAIENSGLLYDETQLPQIHTRHAN
jgi:flavin-dependent dehydrogenase